MTQLTSLFCRFLQGCLLVGLFDTPAFGEQVRFHDNGLAAHYLPPTNTDRPKAVLLFVHGDGPLHYDAEGYYPLIWNQLREQGFAVFSWDKPGIGDSSGDWLAQSMNDRQREVLAAIAFVKDRYGFEGRQIGLVGFSQAGWVVPAVAADNPDVGFIVAVGFAINWLQQGWYHKKTQLTLEGYTPRQIDAQYEVFLSGVNLLRQKLSYKTYIEKAPATHKEISAARYDFILKNFESDATPDYQSVKQPVLLLLGEKDLNVDVHDTSERLRAIFPSQGQVSIHILPGATHALLKASVFNQQYPGFIFWVKMMWMGEGALTPDFLPIIESWLNGVIRE